MAWLASGLLRAVGGHGRRQRGHRDLGRALPGAVGHFRFPVSDRGGKLEAVQDTDS